MNIDKQILEDRQAKITVEYTTEEFESYKRRAAKKISKNAKIPGFRPGKAPYNVVLNHYGEGTILQEAIDILLDDDYGNILDEAEIEPSGVGNLEKIESYNPPKFVFMVPLEPIVDLGEYRQVRKPYELEDFDLSEVNDFVDNIRRNAATIIPAERPAKEGDLVYFNLSGEVLNPEEGEDATITDKTPQQALIPDEDEENENEWPFVGFSKELNGVKAGDIKEIQHSFSEDDEDENLQGKTALFIIEVQSVKELELPELDEEFIKTIGNYESVDDFRAKVEERLRSEHQNSYDETYFNEILNEITEQTDMQYPPQMLEHETEHVLEDIKDRLTKQNMDFETYLKLRDTDEETFIEEEIQPVAKQRLERSLVVDSIIDSEGLKIDEDMLKDHINQIMSEVIYSGQIEEMQKQMGKDEFSRVISMEGVSRTMNKQVLKRLKLIGTGQPIPEDEPEEDFEESKKESDVDIDAEMLDEPEVVEEIVESSEELESEEKSDSENDLGSTEASEEKVIETSTEDDED